ncbi:unnamed protein product [Cuscuta europaea]|uniref:Uncharacterized protein n=1 Tax=Cuscuta europaea TaxID=41803 RepID=A0A9P1EKU7_CUSEU|nr:unnamed protein product [Cuscuta europaea]
MSTFIILTMSFQDRPSGIILRLEPLLVSSREMEELSHEKVKVAIQPTSCIAHIPTEIAGMESIHISRVLNSQGRRRVAQSRQQPQTGEDDGWHTIIYRGRRHPQPNRRITSLHSTNFEINRAERAINHYHRLLPENEIEIDFEPNRSALVKETHKPRVEGGWFERKIRRDNRSQRNRNSKARGRSGYRLDLCDGVSPDHGRGSSREKAMADASSYSAPTTAGERPTSDIQYIEETRRPGSILTLTWADVVESSSDKNKSPLKINQTSTSK